MTSHPPHYMFQITTDQLVYLRLYMKKILTFKITQRACTILEKFCGLSHSRYYDDYEHYCFLGWNAV